MAAVSIVPPHHYHHFDYFNLADPIRILDEFVDSPESETQMEFSGPASHNNSYLEKHKLVGSVLNLHTQPGLLNPDIIHQTTDISYGAHQNQPQQQLTHFSQTNSATNGDFGQLVDFVDSPPDSKEAWSVEYLKTNMHGPNKIEMPAECRTTTSNNNVTEGPNSGAATAIENISMPGLHGPTKKRRMNWDSTLEELNDVSTAREVAPTAGKPQTSAVSAFGGAAPQTGALTSVIRDRERRKSGRFGGGGNGENGGSGGGWTEDIDFDLNNDLSNNGYMSDAFLYSSLTVFKQEVPSPTTQDKNGGGGGGGQQQQLQQQPSAGNNNAELVAKQRQAIINGNGHGIIMQANNANNMQIESSENNSLMNNHQQICSNIQQNGNINNNAGNEGVNFQQFLQDDSYDKINGKVTPPRSEKPKLLHTDDCRFQYVLAAATSIATKNNEDTLTYLNQGQSYEIKLKKLGDLSNFRNKVLRSVIKICFYERRLQYMEKEQMQQWQQSRPGERILEVDVPLSYGLCQVSQSSNPTLFNSVEVMWDPMKEVGVYIKVNCISTEFTPKKHGGEKGVPFRIQVETYLESRPIHAAVCQIKVFKLKGADRKHKQDREKIQKRPASEQEKYQPSYECTILNDIPNDLVLNSQNCALSPDHIPTMIHSPTTNASKYEAAGIQFSYNHPLNNSNSNSSNAITAVQLDRQASSSTPNICKTLEIIPSPPASVQSKEYDEMNIQINKETSPQSLAQWINYHRLSSHASTFAHFSGADLLRLTKDDLIQICGLADGIRMYNVLHKKAITPRLTLFVSLDMSCYHALYLYSNKLNEFLEKLENIPGFRAFCEKAQSQKNNANGTENHGSSMFMSWDMQQSGKEDDYEVYIIMPTGIRVIVTEEVINHIKDESLYTIDVNNKNIILKPIVRE